MLSSERIYERLYMTEDPEKRLFITPVLDIAEQLGPGRASIDLRLGSSFITQRRPETLQVDPRAERAPGDEQSYQDEVVVPFGQSFILHPGQFALAATLEYVGLPRDLGGYVLGRSSWGRVGLIVATAPGVHPNYRGVVTMELTNVGEIPVHLYPGDMIVQMFLHDVSLGQTALPYSGEPGRYFGSTRPEINLVSFSKGTRAAISRLTELPRTSETETPPESS